jgi:hypothetical protein
MKYYNSELDSGKPVDEKILVELLDDVRKSIYSSLNKLNDDNNKSNKDPLEDVQRSNIINNTKIGGNLSSVATRIIEK